MSDATEVIDETMPIAAVVDRGRPAAAAADVSNGRSRFTRLVFLDVIRAVAAPLVMYDHFVSFWNGYDAPSPVVTGIDTLLRQPLRIEQDFGFFGVALFFLVSGFVVTHRATREGAGEFVVKRLLRIYPVLIVVVLFVSIPGVRELVFAGNLVKQITGFTILTNMTLANYVLIPQVVLVGVGWTLAIEVMFYVVLILMMPLLKRWVWAALCVEIAIAWAAIEFARDFGASFFLVAVSLGYLPLLLLGQICWAVWRQQIPLWSAGVFGTAAWLIYTWNGTRDMGRPDDGYGNTAALALLIFILLLIAEPRLRPTRVVSFIADRSYSIYLLHGVIAFPMMTLLRPILPPVLAIVCGVAVTMIAVELSFRGIERPAQKLARRLVRRRAPARSPA
ncbi:MAG TPA: acyltransferase [Pseudonocardiaceae bacterium]|nr:acyltransferase [Pseudonocardiaceae bacterium]